MAIVSEKPSTTTGERPLRTGRGMTDLFAPQTYALGRGNRMRLLTSGVIGTLAGGLLGLPLTNLLIAAGGLNWLSDAPEWLAHAVSAGLPAGFGALTALLVFITLRPRFESFFVAGEEFWLSSEVYKRTQGRRLRSLTFLAIGLFTGWGLWALSERLRFVTWPDWVPLHVARSAPYWIPAVLVALVAWAFFRIVNWPRFADFLIATEAEMTKVSWSSKDELRRATAVVLMTVVLLAAFLLAMDLLWHWILVKIGVLEVPETKQALLNWRSLPAAWDAWLKSWS